MRFKNKNSDKPKHQFQNIFSKTRKLSDYGEAKNWLVTKKKRILMTAIIPENDLKIAYHSLNEDDKKVKETTPMPNTTKQKSETLVFTHIEDDSNTNGNISEAVKILPKKENTFYGKVPVRTPNICKDEF